MAHSAANAASSDGPCRTRFGLRASRPIRRRPSLQEADPRKRATPRSRRCDGCSGRPRRCTRSVMDLRPRLGDGLGEARALGGANSRSVQQRLNSRPLIEKRLRQVHPGARRGAVRGLPRSRVSGATAGSRLPFSALLRSLPNHDRTLGTPIASGQHRGFFSAQAG